MRKINWKILNLALWIEVILSYLLPFKVTDNLSYQVGSPVPFITVYAAELHINPFMSMHLNPIGLLFNAIIMYLILSALLKVYYKFKRVNEVG